MNGVRRQRGGSNAIPGYLVEKCDDVKSVGPLSNVGQFGAEGGMWGGRRGAHDTRATSTNSLHHSLELRRNTVF